jgi:hypothetical protein
MPNAEDGGQNGKGADIENGGKSADDKILGKLPDEEGAFTPPPFYLN